MAMTSTRITAIGRAASDSSAEEVCVPAKKLLSREAVAVMRIGMMQWWSIGVLE